MAKFIEVTDTQNDKRIVNVDHIREARADDKGTNGARISLGDGMVVLTKESFRSVKGFILKATGQRAKVGAVEESDHE